jgi:TP901 family phage tail tape measure protein
MTDRNLRLSIEAEAKGANDVKQLRQELVRAETSIDELRAAVKRQESDFEDARSASIALKTEYKRMQREGKSTADEFDNLSNRIEKADAAQLEAITSTRKLVAELSEADQETGQFADEIADLGKRLNNAEGYITGVTQEVRTMGQGFENVSGDVREVGDRVDKVGDQARRAADGIDKLGDDSRRSADGIEKLNNNAIKFSAVGNIIADGMQDAARAVVDFVRDSEQEFYDFERSSREIFTLIPDASGEMREALKSDALALGTELGRLPDEILPSIYNALSAGVPEDNVLETVRTASDAARAGVADLDSTLQLGLGILNAQVGGVSNLEDVYDQLFFTVKNGVITLPQMNDVMSQVTSVAGEAGVSLQDISAAMIVMTRQGDTAAEAAELLSIMLTQLSTSGTTLATTFEEAAGKSFRQFIAEGGNLAGAMEILQSHADSTGQALGDILGGGSPFFRDTQAARGALELTGKHLEDLIQFANEAEEASGSYSTAAAEMGEASELGSLQAKAAVAELKIALGELAAVKLQPVYEGLTEIAKAASGNRANEVSNLTDELIEQAGTADELVEAGQKIAGAYEEASTSAIGLIATSGGVRDELTGSGEEIVKSLAEQSNSLEEFNQKLEEAGAIGAGGTFATFAGFQFNPEEQFATAQIDKVAESLENVDAKMVQLQENQQNANDAADEYAYTLEELAQMGRDEAQAQADQAQSAAFTADAYNLLHGSIVEYIDTLEEAGSQEAIAALNSQREALEANRVAFNDNATAVLNGQAAETNYKDALFQTAAQGPINQEMYVALALASGEYSEAQIQAALTEAAMKAAVDETAAALQDGKISVEDAISALDDYQAALAEDYTAELDYSDFLHATDAAKDTKKAFDDAAKDYSATFTTTHIERFVQEGSTQTGGGGGVPGSADNPIPTYTGRAFAPGEYMIVGDGPGGQILPTSELVVFDQPGRVFNAAETAQILDGGPGEPGPGGSESSSVINDDAAAAQRPIVVNVTLPNVTDGRQFVGELDQALVALQRVGLSN